MNNPDPLGPFHNVLGFTLSPDPNKYKCHDPYDQYKSLLRCIFGRRKKMHATFSEFCFYPEVNQKGNVHIHGFYKLKNKISYYRWFLPACKQWGWTDIKQRIDDGWIAYCMKDYADTDGMFDDLPHPLTDDSIDYYTLANYRAKHTIRLVNERSIMSYFNKK